MPSPDIRPYTLSPYNVGTFIRDGRVCYPPGPRRTKVAIWGFGSDSKRDVPFDSDEFVIWSINNGWNASRDRQGRLRCDAWWEQHQITPDVSGPERGAAIQDPNDMKWINTCPVPLYTTEPWPANPNAVRWPIEYFAEKYRDYFACSFAMQITQAIEEGFAEIHLFGLMLLMGTKREATVESSCVNWWLGLAEGRGVTVVVHEADWMLLRHPHRYGHEYWLERRFVERYIRELDTHVVAI